MSYAALREVGCTEAYVNVPKIQNLPPRNKKLFRLLRRQCNPARRNRHYRIHEPTYFYRCRIWRTRSGKQFCGNIPKLS